MSRFLRWGLLGLISLFVLSAAWIAWDLRRIQTDTARVDAVALPLMAQGTRLGTHVARSQTELYRYISGDTSDTGRLVSEIDQLDELVADLAQSKEVPELERDVEKLLTLMTTYKQQVSEAITAVDMDTTQELTRQAFHQGLLIQQIATRIEDTIRIHVAADNRRMMASVWRTTWSMVIALIIFIVAAFIIVRWVFRRTMQPIVALVQATNAVVDGDLNQPVEWQGEDELGLLVTSYNRMLVHVQHSRRELEDRNRQLKTLHEIGAALKSSVDLHEVLTFTLQGVTHGLGFEAAQLFLLDRNTQSLRLRLWVGVDAPDGEVAISLSEDHPLIQALMSPKPVQKADVPSGDVLGSLGDRCLIVPLVGRKEWRCWERHDCQQQNCDAYQSPYLHCWMLEAKPCDAKLPRHSGRNLERCVQCDVFSTVGVLAVAQPPGGAVTEHQSEILVTFADQAGLAVETVQIYRYLQQFNRDLEEQVQAATERLMETREQLYQSEKLAAIGRLASGVAHEINNPLAAISTYAQSLLLDIEDPGARKELESIREQVQRASQITRDLLEFARPNPQLFETVDIHRCIEDAVESARHGADFQEISITRQFRCRKPLTHGNPRQLQEVLLNILLNAGQAMEGKGKLILATADTEPGQIEIQISDTGPGIPDDVRPHIFEPFFTTKDVGQGTGLGLYLSYWIVERHGGSLDVKASPSGGATFILRLPQEGQHG